MQKKALTRAAGEPRTSRLCSASRAPRAFDMACRLETNMPAGSLPNIPAPFPPPPVPLLLPLLSLPPPNKLA
eukprot:CAMPEP_0173190070 /NCGR_PEP_ID=MMETSP1141-20130122/12147_1 /TAXON_ID=483371 /ORGANISM="non described non described, Strain CCMP2298" /LENGTH=71 /DNA_ID=CAMNT_0014114151 /DNA_START=200 /DNA_END=412 /DNA_ORIENTATION=+